MKIMIFLVARLVEFIQCLLLNKNACIFDMPIWYFNQFNLKSSQNYSKCFEFNQRQTRRRGGDCGLHHEGELGPSLAGHRFGEGPGLDHGQHGHRYIPGRPMRAGGLPQDTLQ